MWLIFSFISASLLGLYDVTKKVSLRDNAVEPVLWFNTLFSTLIFLPLILSAESKAGWFDGTIFSIPEGDATSHMLVALKSFIVLSSWIFGYYGIKHLPITIVGPINATRPVMVLLGAMVVFGERLNMLQWIGVSLSAVSLFLLSRSGKREGVDFRHNRWIACIAVAALLGAISGLYDRYIMQSLNPLFVQSWYNVYQLGLMTILTAIIWLPKRNSSPRFRWSWAIPMISILISMADFAYFYALCNDEAMISIVSMIRRGSVIVSFACGAIIFHEKNLRAKALDLALIIVGMIFLYWGSR